MKLHLTRVRAALQPRNEPYWEATPIGKEGRVLGYRKIDPNTGTWIARMRDDHNRKRYQKLGLDTPDFAYEQAYAAARQWFEGRDAGIVNDDLTVAEACREYVEDRREKKGEACARDAELRFQRIVYDTPFGALKVAKLHTPRIEQWRRDIGLGKASANRMYTSLKAALNLAVKHRRVRAEAKREWADVQQYRNADKRRELFLDVRQRRALLEHARADVRDLLEAAILTGARVGELVKATRSQFDERTRSMTFVGKTGARTVPLSPAATALFARLARSKLPTAPLLMQQNGERWYPSAWAPLVRTAAERAGLPHGTCAYSLRHAFITEAVTSGMSTLDVARLTGTFERGERGPEPDRHSVSLIPVRMVQRPGTFSLPAQGCENATPAHRRLPRIRPIATTLSLRRLWTLYERTSVAHGTSGEGDLALSHLAF